MSDLSNKPVGAFFSPECGTCRCMTLREHYAGLAMMGLLSNPVAMTAIAQVETDQDAKSLIEQTSVEYADALIAELERTDDAQKQ